MSKSKRAASDLVRLGADPDILAMIARMQSKADAAALAHVEQMALLPPGTCEKCYGLGYINNDPKHPCSGCQEIHISAIGVPYEFRGATFANFTQHFGNKAALEAARAFLAGERDLYLTGGVGAGKTRLACSIANESYKRGKGGHFERVPMMLHTLQPSQAEDIREYERLLWTTPLLVLDDLGAERDTATDYTRRTLLMLYEERCDRRLRTIFTSNKSISELGAMNDDDRLASRIAGRADAVKLTTGDQRLARRGK